MKRILSRQSDYPNISKPCDWAVLQCLQCKCSFCLWRGTLCQSSWCSSSGENFESPSVLSPCYLSACFVFCRLVWCREPCEAKSGPEAPWQQTRSTHMFMVGCPYFHVFIYFKKKSECHDFLNFGMHFQRPSASRASR